MEFPGRERKKRKNLGMGEKPGDMEKAEWAVLDSL